MRFAVCAAVLLVGHVASAQVVFVVEPTVAKAASAPAEPSTRELYLITSPDCIYCPAAKSAADACPELPIRRLDAYRERAAVEALWNPSGFNLSVPAWVLCIDGKPVKWWTGKSNASGIRLMAGKTVKPKASKPVTPPAGRPVGVVTQQAAPAGFSFDPGEDAHRHKCGNCGTIWEHGGNLPWPVSHNCPNCGQTQTVIHSWLIPRRGR